MLNFERYKTNIADICDTGDDIAIVNGVPVGCNTLYDCTECDFDGINETCNYQLLKWATSEYEKPAPKLTRREREFLKCFNNKDRRAITRHTNGKLGVRDTIYNIFEAEIHPGMFSFIKPGETWMFEDLLKLEVEE